VCLLEFIRGGERESCPRVQPKHAKIRKKTKFEGAYMHDGE